MDPTLMEHITPIALAVAGLVALKLYVDSRAVARMTPAPTEIQSLKSQIATLEAELGTERRRRAAYQGVYDQPPPLDYAPEEPHESLSTLAESVVGQLPTWAKPLLDNPRVQELIVDQVAKNPEIIEKLLGQQKKVPTAQPTNMPAYPGGV